MNKNAHLVGRCALAAFYLNNGALAIHLFPMDDEGIMGKRGAARAQRPPSVKY